MKFSFQKSLPFNKDIFFINTPFICKKLSLLNLRNLFYNNVCRVSASCTIELKHFRGVAQLGLARLPWEQEVGGSNPLAPTIYIKNLRLLDKSHYCPLSPTLTELTVVNMNWQKTLKTLSRYGTSGNSRNTHYIRQL